MPIGTANRQAISREMKLVRVTIESIVVERPALTAEQPQRMCLDKGYEDDDGRATVRECGFTAYIRSRGAEAGEITHEVGTHARHRVGALSQRWRNRFRRVLRSWEQRPKQSLAVFHVACGVIAVHAAGLFEYALSFRRSPTSTLLSPGEKKLRELSLLVCLFTVDPLQVRSGDNS